MRFLTLGIITIILLTTISSCKRSGTSPQDSKLIGLASPIEINADTTKVVLSDYFPGIIKIDSIVSDDDIQTTTLNDFLFLVAKSTCRPLSNLIVYAEGLPYSIPVKYLPTIASDSSSSRPSIKTISFSKTEIQFSSSQTTMVYAYWENFRLEIKRSEKGSAILIPPFAKYQIRSHIRIYGCNSNQFSNELIIPLNKGKVVMDVTKLNNNDWLSGAMHYIDLNKVATDSNQASPLRLIGDNILNKKYLNTGINTLLLSQLTTQANTNSVDYITSAPTSYTKINPQYGTEVELTRLANIAHKHGLSVIAEYTNSIAHLEHPLYKSNPEWFIKEERRKYAVLDLMNQKVSKALIDSTLVWMDQFNLDGLAYKHSNLQPLPFIRNYILAVKKLDEEKQKTTFHLIHDGGEGSKELIGIGLYDAMFPEFVKGNQLVWSNNLPVLKQLDDASIALVNMRQQNMAAMYGALEILRADELVTVLRKKYFENEVVVLINNSSEEQKYTYGSSEKKTSLVADPNDFAISIIP
jgi:hypothetical protein